MSKKLKTWFCILFLGMSEFVIAGSITPTDIEQGFDNIWYCKRIFKDFDYQSASPEYKEISVTIYKSDKERLDKLASEMFEMAKQKFGQEDAMRMMSKGSVVNAMSKWKKNISANDVQAMVKQCRDMIYK